MGWSNAGLHDRCGAVMHGIPKPLRLARGTGPLRPVKSNDHADDCKATHETTVNVPARKTRQRRRRPVAKMHAHLILVGIAVVPVPQPQELFVDALRLLPCRVAGLVAVREPEPAGVRRVYLRATTTLSSAADLITHRQRAAFADSPGGASEICWCFNTILHGSHVGPESGEVCRHGQMTD